MLKWNIRQLSVFVWTMVKGSVITNTHFTPSAGPVIPLFVWIFDPRPHRLACLAYSSWRCHCLFSWLSNCRWGYYVNNRSSKKQQKSEPHLAQQAEACVCCVCCACCVLPTQGSSRLRGEHTEQNHNVQNFRRSCCATLIQLSVTPNSASFWIKTVMKES